MAFTILLGDTMWYQKQIKLCSRPRGFHLITAEIMRQLPEISRIAVGIAHLLFNILLHR